MMKKYSSEEASSPQTASLCHEQEAPGNLILFNIRQLTQFRADRPYVQVLSDLGAARIVLFAFRAGQQLKEHRTSSQLLVQVLRGRITLATAENSVSLQAGMVLQLEENVLHNIIARTDAVMLLTMLPSPTEYHAGLAYEDDEHLIPLVKRA
jgi:quercetin dioxygenase-like cupin family protein